MIHPAIKTSYKVIGVKPHPNTKLYGADKAPASEEFAKREGCKRLLVAICQYHANRTSGRRQEYWIRVGKEASFGN